MKALRKLMIFGLVWFFCFSLKEGRADVRTYDGSYDDQPGEEFTNYITLNDNQCVGFAKVNRRDLADVSYGTAANMPAIAGNSSNGFKVDTTPEVGAVICLPNACSDGSGHVGIVTAIGPTLNGCQQLTIKDANFLNHLEYNSSDPRSAIPLIGQATYYYDPSGKALKQKLDYGNGYVVTITDVNASKYSDVQFIHENASVVNNTLNIFNSYHIQPSADQLGALTRKSLEGYDINGYFVSTGNNYIAFPNYGNGQYLHSGQGGVGVEEYKILLKKFEISTDRSNWVTVGEGDVWLDLASVASNSTILANYASNAHIPQGTYRYYRLTHGAYYTIKGRVTDPISGVTYYTTSSFYQSSQPGDNSRTGISSTSEGQSGECPMKGNSESTDPGFASLNGGDFFTWTQPFPQPFQITTGTKKITLTFNMGTGIAFIPDGWVNNGHVNFDMGGTPIIPVVTAQ